MNNARLEDPLDKVSFSDVWQCGQRCIIPAASFDEPLWGPLELTTITATRSDYIVVRDIDDEA